MEYGIINRSFPNILAELQEKLDAVLSTYEIVLNFSEKIDLIKNELVKLKKYEEAIIIRQIELSIIKSIFHYVFNTCNVCLSISAHGDVYEKYYDKLPVLTPEELTGHILNVNNESLDRLLVSEKEPQIKIGRRSIITDITTITPGNYCPDCGGLCGNSNHNRRW